MSSFKFERNLLTKMFCWRSCLKHLNSKPFVLGILFGFILFQIVLWRCRKFSNSEPLRPQAENISESLYESELADVLYRDVKVLCWIMISPKFHHTRGVHIRNTWGRRCNKLLFMSSTADPEIHSIALPVTENITHLWSKTKEAFKYIHENDLDEADWFLKADDDTYMIMENVRQMLSQYKPQTALYFGHRMLGNKSIDDFMQGGAYILSRKALQKFVNLIPTCRKKDGWAEDRFMGKKTS